MPELSKEAIHRIYSYLSLKEVAMTIMKLSKLEREIFEGECAIARECKIFKYEIPHEKCLLHGKEVDNLMKKLDTVIQLVDKLEFTMKHPDKPCEQEALHGFHLEFVSIIHRLPERFNHSTLSIKIVSTSGR